MISQKCANIFALYFAHLYCLEDHCATVLYSLYICKSMEMQISERILQLYKLYKRLTLLLN